jgi:hypothetical protein
MIALGTIMVLGGAFLRLGVSTKNERSSALDQDRAFYLGEAAIAESGAALLSGRSGGIASQALPARLGNGLFWVTSTDLGSGDYQLDATAMCGGGRSALRAVVHMTPSSGVNSALLGDTGVTLGSGVLVDSFDSTLGSYGSQTRQTVNATSIVDTHGDIRSNAGITFAAGDGIFGKVTAGPGGLLSGILASTFLFGSTATATQKAPMPSVVVPTIASSGPKSVMSSDPVAARTLVPGNYHFDSLTLGNTSAFTIQGPATVVVDAFTGNYGCSLHVDATAGPVQIYFTGSSSFSSSMNVTSSGATAKDISLVFTSTNPVTLSANSSLLGTVYAPNASCRVRRRWEVFGAVTAKSLTVSSSAKIHYDQALAATGRGAFPTLSISSWFKESLPAGNLGRKRTDPFALLNVQPQDCPSPANAWQ